jgi:hypothetical protein
MRFAALERVWTRGTACGLASATSNHLRFSLFGIEPEHAVPVAALTHVDDRQAHPGNDYYWLRVDPVTMWADMARVFMTRYGFADLDPYERNEVEACVRDVLKAEGFHLHGEHPERWCIALGDSPGFEFTPLDQALGMDVAEVMPDHPEALRWRRVLNEIQVALHNAPVNQRRRAAGKAEVNSVWFWGGGFIPDAVPSYLLDTVYSDHPVSRGLAIINDFRLKRLAEAANTDFSDDGQAVLIDWAAPNPGSETEPIGELASLEVLVGRLLDEARRGRLVLTLYDGSGRGRSFGAPARRRFWRRNRRLAELLPAPTGE